MHFEHSICIFFHHQNPVSMLVKSLRPIVYATYFYYLFFLFEIRYSKQAQFDILSRTVVGNQCNLNYNATSIRFRIMRNRSTSFSIFLPLEWNEHSHQPLISVQKSVYIQQKFEQVCFNFGRKFNARIVYIIGFVCAVSWNHRPKKRPQFPDLTA